MKALDQGSKLLWEDSVTGKGHADYSEFKKDFPLAARRASKDALEKVEAAIRTKEGLK